MFSNVSLHFTATETLAKTYCSDMSTLSDLLRLGHSSGGLLLLLYNDTIAS